MPITSSLSAGFSANPATIETPSYQERVLFLGANGSGKTILASQLITPYPRVVVLDIKYDFPIPWTEGDYTIVDKPPGVGFLNSINWKYGSDHLIYRPRRPYDSGPWVTYFLDKMFDRGRKEGKSRPFILYLDEGSWVAYSGAKAGMSRLAVSGRSLGIGLWISAQRPRGIPVEVRSEAWRIYVFYLKYFDDRLEITNVMDERISEEDLASTTHNYQFWEIRRGVGGTMAYRLLPPVRIVPVSNNKEQV